MKILIAEDEPMSRKMLEKLLVKWGYETLSVEDGNKAWRALQAEDGPQLALLDWMMPGMDGVEVARKVRADLSMRDRYIYIILITQKGSKEDIVTGIGAGSDDYIVKPFDPQELLVRIRAGQKLLELQTWLTAAKADLEAANSDLQREIGVRKTAERQLMLAHDELEKRVVERTLQLAESNEKLRGEIEERKRAEEIARESEARLRTFFNTAPDCIFIKDLSLKYSVINPSMENLFELPASRILGKTDEDLYDSEAARHLREIDSRVISGETIEEETHPYGQRDCFYIPGRQSAHAQPRRKNSGHLRYFSQHYGAKKCHVFSEAHDGRLYLPGYVFSFEFSACCSPDGHGGPTHGRKRDR